MDKLAILLFDIGLWAMYLIAAQIIFLLIQGITLWTTGFNIHKWLNYNLITRWL